MRQARKVVVLVLAKVYKVPPISLLLSLGTEAPVDVLPARQVATGKAVSWFTPVGVASGPAEGGM